MIYKRGDVVLTLFPNTQTNTFKKRPALIVQADGVKSQFNQTILVPITSKLNRMGATRIQVVMDSHDGRSMGIRQDSIIAIDNLSTVSNMAIDKRLGFYPDMKMVDEILKNVLGLD